MTFVVLETKSCVWTVGLYDQDERFLARSEHDSHEEAMQECAWLNSHLEASAAAGRVLTCAFCGQEYPQGTPASGTQVLIDHIRACKKHPLRDLERRLEKLVDVSMVFIGAKGLNELRTMRDLIIQAGLVGMVPDPTAVDNTLAVMEVLEAELALRPQPEPPCGLLNAPEAGA